MAGGHVVALGVVKFWRVNGSDFNNFLLWCRFQSATARGYFDEAVEDDEEFREMGGNLELGSTGIEFFVVDLRTLS